MYTHDIRTIWKLIVINVPIVISWTFSVTPHSLRVLITIEWRIAVKKVSERTEARKIKVVECCTKYILGHSIQQTYLTIAN